MTEQLSLDALLGEDAVRSRSRQRSRRTAGTPPADRHGPLRHAQDRLRIVGSLSAVAIAELLDRPAPTAEQVAVIEAPVAPLLVVAGAGSGKTETMAARVVWLVANGIVEPEQVLGLTFTRKAAGELAERVRSRLRLLHRRGAIAEPGPVTVATYHSYASAVLADHGLRLGVEPASRLLGEAAAWQLVDALVERWDGDMSEVESARSSVVEHVLSLAGECAEHLVRPGSVEAGLEHLLATAARLPSSLGGTVPGPPKPAVRDVLRKVAARRRLLPLVEAFTRRKRDLEVLDFGDQVALAARIAREVPEVGRSERERFPVVLLDEYQDTSHAQLVLLRALFGAGHPVTAVGDPHQSIYGWRGASAGTLERFPEHFPDAEGTPARAVHLATSWRNDAAVLSVANAVALDLRTAPPWQAPGRAVEVPPLRARPGAGRGAVEVHWHATLEDELTGVADAVAAAWGPPAADAASRPSVAVLCRTRSQFPLLEAALRARGLPVEVVGLGGLLHVPEVADLRAALEVVHDPSRGDSLMRLLTGSPWRLGPRDLAALGAWAAAQARAGRRGRRGAAAAATGPGARPDADATDERSVVEALDRLPDEGWRAPSGEQLSTVGRARLDRLAGVLRAVRSRTAVTLVDLVLEVERALLLDVEVASRPGGSAGSARAHLDAFADVAAAFSAGERRAGLGAFLGWLDAAEKAERGLEAPFTDRRADAVQLLTVHAAKGLEWDMVVVPGMVEGTFPSGSNGRAPAASGGWTTDLGALPFDLRGDADMVPQWRVHQAGSQEALAKSLEDFTWECGAYEVAEERRLAYVAFTRARRRLLLSGAVWADGKRPRMPSRFLVEAAGVAGVDRGTWADEPAESVSNPRRAQAEQFHWPVDPLGDRRDAVEEAAVSVRAARAALTRAGQPAEAPRRRGGRRSAAAPVARPGWAAEVDLLLAERDSGRDARLQVELPGHLSASRLVELAADPRALASRLRRPMPQEPSPHARRGSTFHAWLEQRFAAAVLVDVEELPGSADDAVEDGALAELQRSFLRSEWASRVPEAVEVAVETPVGDLLVRCRIDAVFRGTGAGASRRWDVVDWKTGAPPRDAADVAARSVQLAVYRLAWARLHRLALEQVTSAFFYAATGETVRPVDLLDEAALVRLVADAQTGPGLHLRGRVRGGQEPSGIDV